MQLAVDYIGKEWRRATEDVFAGWYRWLCISRPRIIPVVLTFLSFATSRLNFQSSTQASVLARLPGVHPCGDWWVSLVDFFSFGELKDQAKNAD